MNNKTNIKEYLEHKDTKTQIATHFANNKEREAFIANLLAYGNEKALENIDPSEIMRAMLVVTKNGLSLDKNMGRAYLIPYSGKVQIQYSYNAYRDMADKAGYDVYAIAVKAGDKRGLEEVVQAHRDYPWKENAVDGEIVGYVAVGFDKENNRMQGLPIYMTTKALQAHKKEYSKGGQFWTNHTDTMMKKTVLRKYIKTQIPANDRNLSAVMKYDQAAISKELEPIYIDNPKNDKSEKGIMNWANVKKQDIINYIITQNPNFEANNKIVLSEQKKEYLIHVANKYSSVERKVEPKEINNG